MPLDVQRQLLAQKEIFGGEVRTRAQHRRYELHDVASDARDRAYVEARSGPGHASGWYATDARGDLPLRGHGIRLGAASSGPNSGQILPGWTFADHSPSVWLISRFHREGEAKDYGFR